MDRPSVQERFAPKNRVVIITMRVGMSVPAMAWSTTMRCVASFR